MEVLTVDGFKSKVFDYEKHQQQWKFEGPRPVIVDFYADWCAPCRALGPILERVATDYAGRVDIYKVDTEATPELAGLFGVRGIPAILFIPMTGDPAMNSGLIPQDAFEKAIQDLFGIKK
jgi:thioredoxin 1